VKPGVRDEPEQDQRDAGTDDEIRGRFLPRISFTFGLALKLLLLGVVNALTIWAAVTLIDQEQWIALSLMVVATIGIDYVYLSSRTLPLKYLIPGTIFALVFQVYPVIYSANIALTNYGTGHVLTQEQAIDQILRLASPDQEGARFLMVVMAADGGSGELALYLTDASDVPYLGTAEELTEVDPGEVSVDADGRVTGVGEYTTLNLRQAQDRQTELLALEIPTEAGVITAQTFTTAVIQPARYRHDPDTGLLTDNDTGTVYEPTGGNFVSADGSVVTPGWRSYVGFANFTEVLSSPAVRGPFARVFVWNVAFAAGSVFLTFALGLGLALTLNHPMMRGRRVYRSLLIVPYALPSFMTVLVWQGMLNQNFGVVNAMFGIDFSWLRDPTLAKISILLVNTWLGFAYFFLVSTGALQAIPSELKEAAEVDGASPWRAFRAVVFPLLMVAVAPLLIASFAFNFNNFNVVYLLTGGGPPIAGAQTPAGHTDILISYTYRLAFERGSGTNFGLASAISILIFFIVATISALSFRRTRALEELA
jgi:arabinogalactan oligomer/maltooligosaccharide transport system permease protein